MIQTKGKNRFKLWLHWIVANAMGELVGLGTVSLVALFVSAQFDESASNIATIFFALLMILLGAFEGLAIALAQWLVLRQIIRRITLRAWIVATIIGAIIAWFLGMLPGTIAHLSNQTTNTPPPAISEAQVMFLASVMGVILGLILAFPQWLVLRQYTKHSSWWLGANSLAWACGMPMVFLVAGSIPEGAAQLQIIATLLLTLTAAGAIVGAIHGFFLVWVIK